VVGIAFFTLGDNFTKKFEVGNKVDIVGHLEKDWRGSPRIRIVDIV
jgi:hypothetical protein